MDPGLMGGITGALIGVAGGVVGTCCSIKNTSGPRGRKFMIKVSLVVWGTILLFLALVFALPSPYRWFMFIPYGVLLPLGIMYGNKTQRRIADEESQNH